MIKSIKRIISFLGALRYFFYSTTDKSKLGYCGKNVTLQSPCINTKLENTFIHDNVSIFGFSKFFIHSGKFIVKQNVVVSAGLTIVTGNHTTTLGIPTLKQCSEHINDVEKDVIIEENVWMGLNVTILSGVTVGRGAIVGAGTVVNKDIPPYSVVVGVPAKIVKAVFSKEQIVKHEQIIYNEHERLSKEYLNELFETHLKGKEIYGVEGIRTSM